MFVFYLLSEPSQVNLVVLVGHRYWGYFIDHTLSCPTCSVTALPDQPLTCQLVLISQLFDLICSVLHWFR